MIPALLFILDSSALKTITVSRSLLALAFVILSEMGFVMGKMVAILVEFSAAKMYGLNRTALRPIAVRAIDAHHGVPAKIWMCSRTNSIIAVGPHPKSSPMFFR